MRDSVFSRTETLDAASIKPQVSWGTSPDMVASIDGCIPNPAAETDAIKRTNMENALQYMGLRANTPIADICPDKILSVLVPTHALKIYTLPPKSLKDKNSPPTLSCSWFWTSE